MDASSVNVDGPAREVRSGLGVQAFQSGEEPSHGFHIE